LVWTRRRAKLFKFVVILILIAMFIATGPPGWTGLTGWVLAGVVYLVSILINRTVFFFRRMAAKRRNAGPNSPLNDDRPDVLYLRCFHADAFRPGVVMRLHSDEMDLGLAVRPLGDLVGLGRPGEVLPIPGAARLYAPQDEWKNTVCQQMRVARLVIIRAGQGDGLLWECEEAFRTLSPRQLVILVLAIRADEYQHFATAIQARLGIVVPSIPNVFPLRFLIDVRSDPGMVKPGFIVFSEGWHAQFLPIPLKLTVRVADQFQKALRPVFEAHGVAKK